MESARTLYFDALAHTPRRSSSLSEFDGSGPARLQQAIAEVQTALELFLDNRFEQAEHRLAAYANDSIYHAMGYSSLMFIKAVMTCERRDIAYSLETIRAAGTVIEKWRARPAFHSAIYCSLSGATAAQTDEEVHAELCLAEVLLFRAVLTFLADENLTGFVVGALKIRASYQTYKRCYRLLEDTAFWRRADGSAALRRQFEAGTRMGVGAFNLLLSTLPRRVLRLLQVVGFGGNKAVGYNELGTAARLDGALRAPMAALAFLGWRLFASYFLGNGDPRLADCRAMLRPLAARHPNGAIVLFFRARIALLSGDLAGAVRFYRRSADSQNVYPQFHHACYWELMFCHWCGRRWAAAGHYAKRLLDESKWSACVYAYALAVLIDVGSADGSVPRAADTVALLLRRVPSLRLRIAGKSIPIEKFCEAKARRHQRRKRLYWAHYEFLYFMSGFSILESVPHNFELILEDIEDYWRRYPSPDVDDQCLYSFLRGVCLRALGRAADAEECLTAVLLRERQLIDFVYLAPNACFELALLHAMDVDATTGRRLARQMLAKAHTYRGYPLQTKLHFRTHHLSERLDEIETAGGEKI